ncbi:hypothetical protein [Thiorhodovibrio winogradskyi]|nr:hypothetical protein [Thiorhodovibrio winogradskyi]
MVRTAIVLGLVCAFLVSPLIVLAEIPATPVMTLYQFNGPIRVPYYQIGPSGPGAVAGYLSQGTSVVPCLVVRNGQALTDAKGTPYVGFEIIVNSAKAGPEATEKFKQAISRQNSLKVANHHCPPDVRHVLNIRHLYALTKAPYFDPPRTTSAKLQLDKQARMSELDLWVRKFHNSDECAGVGIGLLGRRERLARAWDDFISRESKAGDAQQLARAKHLDYSMRTAIYEGHLDRGCSAYGACERNVVVLSIRNRALGQCLKGRGCRFPGDFQGAASEPSQYNIWDAYLTQISGLTACYLRSDLATHEDYRRIQLMHQQSVGDAERILFGSDQDLSQVFPDNTLSDLKEMRHYYHPPAMQKCFPQKDRIEYMSGAVAENNGQFALIANTRIEVGQAVSKGYLFKEFRFDHTPEGDKLRVIDNYPGFIVDARKVSLKSGHRCTPYGVSPTCQFTKINRYRTIPSWLSAGKPLAITCRIKERGETCKEAAVSKTTRVGGNCDTEMMPVTHVP